MFVSSLYLYPIIAAIIAFVFMYLDTRLFDTKKEKSTYIKNMVLVAFIVWAFVFILDLDSTVQVPFSEKDIKFIPEINERMLKGLPNF